VEFTRDGQKQVLAAGDFCVVPQGLHFSYRNREAKEAQICLVHTPSFDINSEVLMDESDG
jgi:mannose-6-phosphate isomerase-like protein (cupin superfamily)